MRKLLILFALTVSSHSASNAQIAENCALFRSSVGETMTMDQMNDLEADLLREARRGQVMDMSYGGTAKEIAAREAEKKKAEQAAAQKRAKVQETLASYKCIQDIYGNTPDGG